MYILRNVTCLGTLTAAAGRAPSAPSRSLSSSKRVSGLSLSPTTQRSFGLSSVHLRRYAGKLSAHCGLHQFGSRVTRGASRSSLQDLFDELQGISCRFHALPRWRTLLEPQGSASSWADALMKINIAQWRECRQTFSPKG